MPAHAHTHISSTPIALSCPRGNMMNWTSFCGEAERWMLLVLLFKDIIQDPLQVCPIPTLRAEAVFICATFSPEKKYAYMNVYREPEGDKNKKKYCKDSL